MTSEKPGDVNCLWLGGMSVNGQVPLPKKFGGGTSALQEIWGREGAAAGYFVGFVT